MSAPSTNKLPSIVTLAENVASPPAAKSFTFKPPVVLAAKTTAADAPLVSLDVVIAWVCEAVVTASVVTAVNVSGVPNVTVCVSAPTPPACLAVTVIPLPATTASNSPASISAFTCEYVREWTLELLSIWRILPLVATAPSVGVLSRVRLASDFKPPLTLNCCCAID